MAFDYCDKLILINKNNKNIIINVIDNIISIVLNLKTKWSYKKRSNKKILKYLKSIDNQKYENYIINCFHNKNKLYLFNIKDVYYVLKKYELINFNNNTKILNKYFNKYNIIKMMH
jgi:hypothetical protein